MKLWQIRFAFWAFVSRRCAERMWVLPLDGFAFRANDRVHVFAIARMRAEVEAECRRRGLQAPK